MSHTRQADYAAARAVCVTRDEMAAMLGVEPETVTAQIINFDLPRFGKKRHPDDLRSEIVSLYQKGEQLNEIGERFGFTRSKVAGILHRAGAFKARPEKRVAKVRKVRPSYTTPKAPPTFAKIDFKKREAAVTPHHIGFMDLELWHCREPYGDEPRTMTFCGHQVAPGLSYCPHHAAINYAAPVARNRNPRPR